MREHLKWKEEEFQLKGCEVCSMLSGKPIVDPKQIVFFNGMYELLGEDTKKFIIGMLERSLIATHIEKLRKKHADKLPDYLL